MSRLNQPEILSVVRVFGMIIGYARVSSEDQHLDVQIEVLETSGSERIKSKKIFGSKAEAAETQQAC